MMNQRLIKSMSVAALLVSCCALSVAQTQPTHSMASVNGVAIPESLLTQNINANIAQGQKDSPELRQVIKEELINREVLAQESARLGLDKTPDAQAQWAQVRQTFLVELLLNDLTKRNPLTDAEVKAEFDRQMATLAGSEQYKIGLIVLPTEDVAKATLARLRKGENFSKVATEVSIDPSKKDGGSVGWVLPGQILPAIANVMVNLAKGTLVAAPIQTPTGWNIIKVEDKRPFKAPTFDEAKNEIRNMLAQKQRFEYVKKLRDAAKVAQ
jgi:peptidyl-prolyl cis-trans isomerase C